MLKRSGGAAGACVDDSDWVDIDGDACDAYQANPLWCYDAQAYRNDNETSAADKCCVCYGVCQAIRDSLARSEVRELARLAAVSFACVLVYDCIHTLQPHLRV